MAIISIVSFLVSALGFACFAGVDAGVISPSIFIAVTTVSLVLPIVAKCVRVKRNKKGKAFEILAIIVAGFNFYCIIFLMTQAPIAVGYVGWIGCAVFYKVAG